MVRERTQRTAHISDHLHRIGSDINVIAGIINGAVRSGAYPPEQGLAIKEAAELVRYREGVYRDREAVGCHMQWERHLEFAKIIATDIPRWAEVDGDCDALGGRAIRAKSTTPLKCARFWI